MNCPKCGAPAYREAYKPGFPPSKKWVCGTVGDMRSSACYEAEIEQLRSKLTPEGAEPLKWRKFAKRRILADSCLGRLDVKWNNDGGVYLYGCKYGEFPTIDAAKAHAEELHQASWRELIEKWGKK